MRIIVKNFAAGKIGEGRIGQTLGSVLGSLGVPFDVGGSTKKHRCPSVLLYMSKIGRVEIYVDQEREKVWGFKLIFEGKTHYSPDMRDPLERIDISNEAFEELTSELLLLDSKRENEGLGGDTKFEIVGERERSIYFFAR